MHEVDIRKLNCVVHTFDGDNRLRASWKFFFMRCTENMPDQASITVEHPLMQIRAVHPFKDKRLCLLPCSDWLHIGFRFRVQWLIPRKKWDIGGLSCPISPFRAKGMQISDADLDHRNKQSFGGMYLKKCTL